MICCNIIEVVMKELNLTVIVFVVTLLSCSSDGEKDSGDYKKEEFINGNIYIALNNMSGCIYKNNELSLQLQAGHYDFNDMVVDGQDIYIAGRHSSYVTGIAGYFKNGEFIQLPDCGYARKIYKMNEDIYVAGEEFDSYKSKYWKNGIKCDLPEGIAVMEITKQENSIVFIVLKNEGYNVGNSADIGYMKNNQFVLIRHGLGYNVSYKSFSFVGKDVYYVIAPAASDKSKVMYGKNDEIVTLTDGSVAALASSFYHHNGDLYVCGFEGKYAKYWKNGISVTLSDGSKDAIAKIIRVIDEDVFVWGIDGKTLVLWKNGEQIKLFNNYTVSGRYSSDPIYVN